MELFVPTAFVELAMGISAFFVALVALVVPNLGLQVFLWMVFSLVLVFLTRQLIPKRQHSALQEAIEAQTLTEIAPGKTGRVIFEGNSWQAKCESDCAIGPDEKVIVVGRSGNTLFVLPES
ncbi:MAG: NfeD family protein [Cyanobacteriota bacterium]|nr:NfeD family protein [Cyanobacteriota bacterium]